MLSIMMKTVKSCEQVDRLNELQNVLFSALPLTKYNCTKVLSTFDADNEYCLQKLITMPINKQRNMIQSSELVQGHCLNLHGYSTNEIIKTFTDTDRPTVRQTLCWVIIRV